MNIFNGDCLEFLKILKTEGTKVDAVITSPPYNVSRKSGDDYSTKYKTYKDTLTNEDYINWQTDLFNKIDDVLEDDGVVLYNINYGGENTDTLWLLLANIIQNTNFTIVDQIIWKKKTAIPNNVSRCAITRICENIFVLSKKNSTKTFLSNKKVVSVSKSGQNIYENVLNFVEAKNNDGGEHTKIHKATYSVELCETLIDMYVPVGKTVLDPFMGSGTTGIACINKGVNFIGSEIDEEYFKISESRLKKTTKKKTADIFGF